MQRLLLLLLSVGVWACGNPDPLVGDEIAWVDDPVGNHEDRELDLTVELGGGSSDDHTGTAHGLPYLECDDEPAEPSLDLYGAAGRIDVTHSGYSAQCCPRWEIAAEVVGEAVIGVTYTDVATDPCDCDCPQTLIYAIHGVTSGDWTVRVPGSEGQVTVP